MSEIDTTGTFRGGSRHPVRSAALSLALGLALLGVSGCALGPLPERSMNSRGVPSGYRTAAAHQRSQRTAAPEGNRPDVGESNRSDGQAQLEMAGGRESLSHSEAGRQPATPQTAPVQPVATATASNNPLRNPSGSVVRAQFVDAENPVDPELNSGAVQAALQDAGESFDQPRSDVATRRVPTTATSTAAPANTGAEAGIQNGSNGPPATPRSVSSTLADTGFADGHYRSGIGYRGQLLHDEPKTATEHAIDLRRDNDYLKTEISRMHHLNAELMEEVKFNQQTLQKSAEEIAWVRGTLERLTLENQSLRQQIALLEAEKIQTEREYREFARGIEQTLDELVTRAATAPPTQTPAGEAGRSEGN